MSPNCVERRVANVAPQALQLLNDNLVNELAHAMASRVVSEESQSREDQINRVYMLAYGRVPTSNELRLCHEQLVTLEKTWMSEGDMTLPAARLNAMGNLCRVIMNSAEFLYIE